MMNRPWETICSHHGGGVQFNLSACAAWSGVTAALLLAGVGGCGDVGDTPPAAAVHGSVRVEGELLREGLITFIPQGATLGPKVSAVIEGGIYEIAADKGLQPGMFRVEVDGMPPGVKSGVDGLPPETPAAEYREIAAEFDENSQLTVTLQEGENIEDFDVDYR